MRLGQLGNLGRLVHQVMDFCYPSVCACCEEPCEGAVPVCAHCMDELRRLECGPACRACARPLAQAEAPCPYCRGKGTYPYQRILRLGTFRDPLKKLVHHAKYHRRWPLAEHLADRLLEQEPVKGILTETDYLLPVPLHRLRQIGRGYNQAEVIARRLSRRCGVRLIQPVVRLRNTETQTHLHSHAKRIENMREAFGLVSARQVTGRHVVVVDDVMTSGATLQAVGRILRPAKPASLCAIVLAVADPRGQDFQAI